MSESYCAVRARFTDQEHGDKGLVTCGTCVRSWCELCDPAPSAISCHWCHGRGYSIAELATDEATAEAIRHERDEEQNTRIARAIGHAVLLEWSEELETDDEIPGADLVDTVAQAYQRAIN